MINSRVVGRWRSFLTGESLVNEAPIISGDKIFGCEHLPINRDDGYGNYEFTDTGENPLSSLVISYGVKQNYLGLSILFRRFGLDFYNQSLPVQIANFSFGQEGELLKGKFSTLTCRDRFFSNPSNTSGFMMSYCSYYLGESKRIIEPSNGLSLHYKASEVPGNDFFTTCGINTDLNHLPNKILLPKVIEELKLKTLICDPTPISLNQVKA